jgi:5-hydroxyisourate hydrolase-like protein (transthyretin family)
MSRILQKWITLFFIALSTTWTVTAAPSDGGNSSISGKVTASDGQTPLGSIEVAAYQWLPSDEEFSWVVVGSSVTQADGNYSISGLKSGSYQLEFYDANHRYVSEFFNDVRDIYSAESITVGEASAITGINASLVMGGKITGKITGPDGITPLTSIEVNAFHWDEDDQDWYWSDSASTSTDGTYTILGLAAGDYRIQFNDNWGNYLGEYYDNATGLFTAKDIAVGESLTVPNINASLAAAGKITGTITGADGLAPLENINVYVYEWNEEDEYWDQITSARTSATGFYSAGGLLSGTYRIEFYDQTGSYQGEYYNNATSLGAAQEITVVPATAVTGINASLVERGKITGTVTAPDGVTPLEGIEVRAYYWDEDEEYWDWDRSTYSTADGQYFLRGLSEGSYRVRFFDPDGNYLSEFFDNAANQNSARAITVGASATISGINASLSPAGKISGTVTGPDGITPLEEIYIDAYQWNEDDEDWEWIRGATTDEQGHYRVGGLSTGSYRVQFHDESENYRTEYYNNSQDIYAADDIVVTNATTLTGIDASLAERGKITGKVTAADGITPLAGVEVRAYYWEEDWEDWTYDERTYSLPDGSYTIRGLDARKYRVRFRDLKGDFITEYHENAPDLETADDIEVGTSGTISGIDASLERAGKITGTITGSDGVTPLRDIYVEVYRWDESELDWSRLGENYDYTGSDGGYAIAGLPAGIYRLAFHDEEDIYQSEHYDNSPDLDGALNITLGAAATVSGINASLAELGKISGKITGQDGVTPLEDVQVRAYFWNEEDNYWDYDESTYSDSNGGYTVHGLAAGNYRIRFYDYDGRYLTEYYDNATNIDSASGIAVGISATVAGVNASLAEAGKIKGKVTDYDGTTPLEDIEVRAYYWNEEDEYWDYDETAFSNSNGAYTIDGLEAGTYRIRFYDYGGEYISEYYNNVTEVDSASDIAVGTSVTISGIDASLARAGKITGTITGPDGTTPLENIEVRAYYWNEERNYWYSDRYSQTSEEGRYTISGLFPRKYRIQISDENGNYISEYYNDVSGLELAADIPVASASTVSGIDASLLEGGRIAGRVTAPDGASPLEEIQVVAYRWNTDAQYWQYSQNVYTDEDGYYSLRGLKADTYRLGFYDTDGIYLTEYYNNKPDISSAMNIVISGTATISGINASMNTEFEPNFLAAVSGFRKTGPGAYAMDFKGENGRYYQLQSSGTLGGWIDVGAPFMAGPDAMTIPTTSTESKMFWRIRTIP